MAAQVSLSELISTSRTTTSNRLGQNARSAFGEYHDFQKINANNFAEVYHDKVSERQALVALRSQDASKTARPEPNSRTERAERVENQGRIDRVERTESQSAKRSSDRAANNDKPSESANDKRETTARNGENLPVRGHAEPQDDTEEAANESAADDLNNVNDPDKTSGLGKTEVNADDAESQEKAAEGALAVHLSDQTLVAADQLTVEQTSEDTILTENQLLTGDDFTPTPEGIIGGDVADPLSAGAELGAMPSATSTEADSMNELLGSVNGSNAVPATSDSAGVLAEDVPIEGQLKNALNPQGQPVSEQLVAADRSSQQSLKHATNGLSPVMASGKLDGVADQTVKGSVPADNVFIDKALVDKLPATAGNSGLSQSMLSNALSAEGEEGDTKVTQQFKDLSANLHKVGQQTVAMGTVGTDIIGLERPEALRASQLEAIAQDKTLAALPPSVAVRNGAPLTMPQSTYITNLPMPLQSPAWQNGIAQKLVWFVSEKIQSAKIHVSPPELGPVEMKIQVTKDQAQIHIQSPHAVVRDLLEGTAQRLREMMAAQGIELTEFDVGSQGQQAEDGEGAKAEGQHADGIAGTIADNDTVTATENLEMEQLVDYYV